MDRSHQIIDELRTKRMIFMDRDFSPPAHLKEGRKIVADILSKDISEAHKFDIRAISCDVSDALLRTAIETNYHGMLKLPFDNCFFDFGEILDSDKKPLSLCVLAQERPEYISGTFFAKMLGRWSTCEAGFCLFPNKRHGFFKTAVWSYLNAEDETRLQRYDNSILNSFQRLMISLTIMDTKHAKHDQELAPNALNKKRIANGKPPLFDHTVVTIDYSTADRPSNGISGTHASPRLHWRRGHIRVMGDGNKIRVRPCLVGDPSLGPPLSHEYIVSAAA